MTRLVFATDLHGNAAAYDALWSVAQRSGADAVVLGGDLLPLPLGKGEGLIEIQRRFVRETLGPGLRRVRQEQPDLAVYGLLGNDDWVACLSDLETLEREGAISLLHARAVPLDATHHIAGYSCVPLTPFKMSDWDRYDSPGWRPGKEPSRLLMTDTGQVREGSLGEVRARGTIEDDLRALARLSDPATTVYVTHSPPHATKLDRMHGGRAIGSPALRAFIEEHQPPLTLHGHVHESPRISGAFHDALGATLCVNPGDSRSRLRAVSVDLDDLPGSLRRIAA